MLTAGSDRIVMWNLGTDPQLQGCYGTSPNSHHSDHITYIDISRDGTMAISGKS